MKTHKNLYSEIYSTENLFLSFLNARKGKTKKSYVKRFEKNLELNLEKLQNELKTQTYKPKPLETFILRDPKTRKISKSDFRDRIVHHAICNVIESIFDKTFIYNSCANRKNKGNLFATKRFEKFRRKVTDNFSSYGYCLKADIKHYFHEINHNILINLIGRKIKDEKVIWLIKRVIRETDTQVNSSENKGLPLGNLTSQFFANVYLHELDLFLKHNLKAKHYVRYVDDFIVLHKSKFQLKEWKRRINEFLKERLKLELHSDKSKINFLSKGTDFVGFRNFYYFKLPRKRNIKSMENKIKCFSRKQISKKKISEIFQGWNAYSMWADTYNLRRDFTKEINGLKRKLKTP